MKPLSPSDAEENGPVKLPDGTVIRFVTRKLGLTVFRQRFKARDGTHQYSRPYYLSKMVNGEIARFPLGTDKAKAERLAEEIFSFLSIPTNTLAMAVAQYNPRHAVRTTKYATIGDCLQHFEAARAIIGRNGQSVSESSFKGYRSFLLTLIRKAEAHRDGKPFESFFGRHGVDYSTWLNRSTEILTAGLVTDFKLGSLPPKEEEDEEVILTAKITADTTLRNGRAIFSQQALRYYKQVKLIIPDLDGFLSEPDFSAKKYFVLLPPEVVVRIMRDSLALRASDIEAYRAFLLCVHCGMRAGEAAAFRPSWMRIEDRSVIQIHTKGAFNPKHGHGRKAIVADWVYNTIEDLRQGEEFIKDREAFERLNTWIKQRIPKEHAVSKPTHELRKLWMSHKVKDEGLLAAAQQGGHDDPKVTKDHYADNGMPDWLCPLWELPTEEALKQPQFNKKSA